MAEDFWNIEIGDIDFDDDEKKLIVSQKSVPTRCIKYKNAEKLAKETDLDKNKRYECIIKGNFIYGDFIEAFFVENDIYTDELTISTLSLGYENIDSINNLIKGGMSARCGCWLRFTSSRTKGSRAESWTIYSRR